MSSGCRLGASSLQEVVKLVAWVLSLAIEASRI
jgi:hypothetical protein